MKYDKYGDPIVETAKEFTSKQKVLFGIVIALQILMILANVLILVVPFLNLYLCFITNAPAKITDNPIKTYSKNLPIFCTPVSIPKKISADEISSSPSFLFPGIESESEIAFVLYAFVISAVL